MTATAPAFSLPLIAILRGIAPDDVLTHAQALADEGFEAIEVPSNSPGWTDSVALLAGRFGGRLVIGGGTILTPAHAEALASAGGTLAVTPNTRPALIRHATALGLQVAAGFATPSEAFDALDAGAALLKLFPASTYGPGHVRALRAVLPGTPLFAVGGIGPDTLPAYLAAGSTGAGLGGELYRPGQPVERTRAQARAFRQAYETFRA